MLGPMPTARPLESLGMSQSHSLNAQTLSLNRPTACGLALLSATAPMAPFRDRHKGATS